MKHSIASVPGDLLSSRAPDLRRIILTCPPVGMAPGTARARPERLAALVRRLQAAGWEVRTDRMALPECALTGCALIEARHGGSGTGA